MTSATSPDAPSIPTGHGPWGAEKRPLVRWVIAASLLIALVYCVSPVVLNGDSYLLVPTATSLVHHGDLNVDEYQHLAPVARHYANGVVHGHYYNRFPWVESLLFVPAVVAVDAFHHVGVGPGMNELITQDRMGGIQLVMASLVTAAAAAAIMLMAYERLHTVRRRRRAAIAIGLLFGFGTSAWSTASRAMWQHGPSMLCLAIALLLASIVERPRLDRRVAGRVGIGFGVAVALAYTMRPSNVIAVIGFTAWMLWRHREHFIRYALGAASVAVPWCIVNVLSFGSLLTPYHSAQDPPTHQSYANALVANFFSPARGLFIFTPLALLSIVGLVLHVRARRRHEPTDGLEFVAISFVIGIWLLVSASSHDWVWWAGDAYGPRFFTDTLPFLVLLALPCVGALQALGPATRRRRLALAAVAALALWSVAVNLEGGVIRASSCWNVDPVPVRQQLSRIWDWRDAQFTRGYRRLFSDGPHDAVLAKCATPPGA